MMNYMENYRRYKIFEGITDMNLKTLTDCVTGEKLDFHIGEEIYSSEKECDICMMMLEGSAEALMHDDRSFQVGEGILWGERFFRKNGRSVIKSMTALTDCRVQVLDPSMMFEPCWFSCYFHALFIENLEKAEKRQWEIINGKDIDGLI